MSENYSLKELNEWAEKVIDCISKWADEMNKAFNGTPASIKIEKLDFSEHDKVFEDKIAELENIINNKLGGWDKHGITYQEILDMKAENDLLKQHIAELESKETESVNELPASITIDGYKCKIIKTESGLYISRYEIYSIIDKEKEPLKQKCKELEDRYQSDCVEINRLNTTIDVLIHKVEYLRQFAGLE